MIPGACLRFGFSVLISSVRFSALDHLPAVLRKPLPDTMLPPDFGMMFITGPPMSLSPRPPPTVVAISSALTVSYTTDAKPPLRAAVNGNPLIAYRPSPATVVELIVLDRA